jgi:preprotein translocase SecE subunit
MNDPVLNQEEEIIDEELPASPQLAPPLGPPRRPRIATGLFDNFFHEHRWEMSRFTWPTLNEVKTIIIVVLSIIIFFSLYLNVIDRVILLIGKLGEKLLELIGIV